MRYIILLFMTVAFLHAESLFQVKDSSGSPVLDVSDNGMTILNANDTLMTITSQQIKAFVDQNASKGLSRSFSVTSVSSRKATNKVFSVSNDVTTMWEGTQGERYTEFSPQNIFLGLNAGENIDGGKYNVFIGNNAGNTTTGPEIPDMFEYGYYNTFIGYSAGRTATSSEYNTYIGAKSGELNGGGGDNTFIGTNSGSKNTGSNNTFVGSLSAGYNSGDGYSNSFFGSRSGADNTTGYSNVFIGSSAGGSNQTGYNNVYVGRYAGGSCTSGFGNVFIGNLAGSQETGSNKLYIDNSNTTTPLMYGDFGTNNLVFNTSKVYVKHASGMNNGLYIQNSGYSNYWHFYQYSTGGLHLYYNGIQRGSWNSTTGAYTSYSKEAKNSIEDLDGVTNKVMELQPKKFNFMNQKSGEMKYIGLIAQEVKEIFPSLVVYNEETDTHGMDYSRFGVLAIKAIQEQQEEIVNLKTENQKLLSRIEAIEALLKK